MTENLTAIKEILGKSDNIKFLNFPLKKVISRAKRKTTN